MLSFLLLASLGATPSYMDAAQKAVSEQRPLVVFVGTPAMAVKGCVTHQAPRFDWQKAPAVIVAVPAGDWLEWSQTLRPMASLREIEEAVVKAKRWTGPMPQLAPAFYSPPAMMFGSGRGGGGC